MEQTVERGHRPHIGKEAELAHGQQASLRAHLQCGVVVEARVSDSSEEHSVGVHADLERLFGERVATDVDGVGSADGLTVHKLVSKLLGDGVEHMDGLRHDFWPDAVSGQYCDIQFHDCLCVF